MCENASLTGALDGGQERVALRYNSVLRELIQQGRISASLFEELDPKTATYATIGVESRMLSAYVSDERKRESDEDNDFGALIAIAPFTKAEDLSAIIRERIAAGGRFHEGLLPALAPFLDSGTISEIIRTKLMGKAAKYATPPTPPTPPAPEEADTQLVVATDVTVESADTLESLAAKLREPGLSTDERSRIAQQLAKIAHEQANIAIEPTMPQ